MNSFAKSLDDPKYWRGITDQVMGGRSDLVIAIAMVFLLCLELLPLKIMVVL